MENNNEKQLKVSAIKNGTVLDHIPSGQVFKVIDILGLYDSPHPVTFGEQGHHQDIRKILQG